MISLIVAHDRERGIGRNNELVWHYPEDMKHFKETTMGNIVVMGRKTFESIGSKGLKGRTNIVLSQTLPLIQEDAYVERHFEPLLKRLQNAEKEVFIIGGEQIYKLFLHHADRAIVTEVDGTHDCDAFFPRLYGSSWNMVDSRENGRTWIHEFEHRKTQFHKWLTE